MVLNVVGFDDLDIDDTKIVELRGKSEEERARFMLAIVKEIKGLCELRVFSYECLLEKADPITTKFVLKVKTKADGTWDKDKARLVARGFKQIAGKDFYSSFAPTPNMVTTRTLMAKGVQNGSFICSADVPQAFLQAEPDRTLCVSFPEGISVKSSVSPSKPGGINHRRVGLVLLKALYGLKQSPLLWSEALAALFAKHGYTRSTSDPCLFYKIDGSDRVEVVVFVDDLLLVSKCMRMLKILKAALEACFNNAVGKLTWDWRVTSYLGIDINYDQAGGTLYMSVAPKLEKIFEDYPLLDDLTPIDAIYPAGPAPEMPTRYLKYVPLLLKEYRKLVGLISWCSQACRPDLSPAINKCASGLVAPQHAHLIVLLNILRYIKETSSWCLKYSNKSPASIMLDQMSDHLQDMDRLRGLPVILMSDADHASSNDDPRFRSISGNIGLVYGNLVYWCNKRQTTTARNVMESELIAGAHASDEAVWFKNLMTFIHMILPANLSTSYDGDSQVMPVPILMDNVSAIQLANHPKTTQFSRHIAMREFRIRDACEAGDIRPMYCPRYFNLADYFTKLYPQAHHQVFIRLRFALGVVPPP